MKRTYHILALALLAAVALGSCTKVNEQLNDEAGAEDALKSERIASVSDQRASILTSIADLNAFSGKIADGEALEKRIGELQKYVDGEMMAYSSKEWAKATLATLGQYEATCDVVAGIEAAPGSACTISLKNWINELFEGYYTAALLEAKVSGLKARLGTAENSTKALPDSASANLAAAGAAIESAKSAAMSIYRDAIVTAISESDGRLTGSLRAAIVDANEDIEALAEMLSSLESDIDAITGEVDELETRIQTMSVIPDDSDGSVSFSRGYLNLNCLISPASAVEKLNRENFAIVMNDFNRIPLNHPGDTVIIDTAKGLVKIKVDLFENLYNVDVLPTVALSIDNGVSNCISDFFRMDGPYGLHIMDGRFLNQIIMNAFNEAGPDSQAAFAAATDEAAWEMNDGQIQTFTANPQGYFMPETDIWDNACSAIAEIDSLLETPASGLPEALQPTLDAHLHFLKAYLYFELFKTYGAVPFTQQGSPGKVENIVKTIVEELDAIADKMSVSYSENDRYITLADGNWLTRPTRCAAYALKARTLLYAASPLFNTNEEKSKWEEAAVACKAVIDNASDWGLSLSPYNELCGENGFTNSELIFGIQYPSPDASAYEGFHPAQNLADQYEFQNNGQPFKERNPETFEYSDYDGIDPRFGHTVRTNNTGCYSLIKKVFQTLPMFRLSEFYLDFAEAVFQATGRANDATFDMSANEAVNLLRTRSDINMPKFKEDGAEWVARYERERLVELAFEGHRFWDVRRWKKGVQYFNAIDAGYFTEGQHTRATMPIVWSDEFNLYTRP